MALNEASRLRELSLNPLYILKALHFLKDLARSHVFPNVTSVSESHRPGVARLLPTPEWTAVLNPRGFKSYLKERG